MGSFSLRPGLESWLEFFEVFRPWFDYLDSKKLIVLNQIENDIVRERPADGYFSPLHSYVERDGRG